MKINTNLKIERDMSFNIYIALILLWVYIIKLNDRIKSQTDPLAPMLSNNINIKSQSLQNIKKMNCDGKENILCNLNIDCLSMCQLDNNIWSCKQGRCEQHKEKLTANNEDIKCNEKHGIYRAIENINALNAAVWSCVAMYPTLWNDEDKKNPGVCNGGTLNTDISDHPPQIDDCLCPEKTVLAYFDSRQIAATTIQTPVCIPENEMHLYPGYTKYEPGAQ